MMKVRCTFTIDGKERSFDMELNKELNDDEVNMWALETLADNLSMEWEVVDDE